MQSPDPKQVIPLENLACFAYQTPPYKDYGSDDACSTKGPPSNNAFNELLVDKLATLLRMHTMKCDISRTGKGTKNLREFLKELLKRCQCNRRASLLAAVYFEKIYQVSNEIPDFGRCPRRIYLCCLILAHKFLHDKTLSLNAWRLISGLKPRELSFMERWCLGRLDYQLHIKDEELRALEGKLLKLAKSHI